MRLLFFDINPAFMLKYSAEEGRRVFMSIRYYMMVEPSFAGTHWCEQCIQGIRQEAARNKGLLEEVKTGDEKALEKVLQQERPLLILVGSFVNWMTRTVEALNRKGIHCIMMTAQPPDGRDDASTISMDYRQAICGLFAYLGACGKKKTALFGVHPDSINDLTKQRAYCDIVGRAQEKNIFQNHGDLASACEAFYQRIEEYDSVICSNDIIAIKLLDFLKEKKMNVPERMHVVSIGETRLAQLVRPRITTASLNFADIGHNAVRLYNILRRNTGITALHAKLEAGIHEMEQLPAVRPAAPHIPNELPEPILGNFYEDQDVQRIFMLENLISHCQPIDFAILKGMMEGIPYREIAETHYISDNAVKYRLKRMLELAQCENKDQLLQLVSLQLRPEDLPVE